MRFYQESPPPRWGRGRVGVDRRSLGPPSPSSSPTGERGICFRYSKPIRRCVRGTHPTGTVKLFIAFVLDFFGNLFEDLISSRRVWSGVPSRSMRRAAEGRFQWRRESGSVRIRKGPSQGCRISSTNRSRQLLHIIRVISS